MLKSLITSKTRVKLLHKFFLNINSVSYLRGLEAELKETSNAIRVELLHLEADELLNSFTQGKKKYYKANVSHPLFDNIRSMVIIDLGIDCIIKQISTVDSNIDAIILTGSYAKGINGNIIDLVIIGGGIDLVQLDNTVRACEKTICKNIRYMILAEDKIEDIFKKENTIEIWRRSN